MTAEERSRIRRICYDSKRGNVPSSEDYKFVQAMHKKYPKEYSIISKAAAEEAMQDFQFWRGKK